METKAPTRSKKRMSTLGRDILVGLKEYAAYKRGETTGVKLYTFPTIPQDVDVKSIRGKLGMTQEQFTTFGFSLSAIRHWEGPSPHAGGTRASAAHGNRPQPYGGARNAPSVLSRDARNFSVPYLWLLARPLKTAICFGEKMR